MTTEDGYILGLQRIPRGRGAGVAGGWGGAGQPVLLQHGVLVVRMHGAKHSFVYLFFLFYQLHVLSTL